MAKALKRYPQKPNAPKASASLSVHERYATRMADWNKKCKEVDSYNSKVKSAQKKSKTLNEAATRRKASGR